MSGGTQVYSRKTPWTTLDRIRVLPCMPGIGSMCHPLSWLFMDILGVWSWRYKVGNWKESMSLSIHLERKDGVALKVSSYVWSVVELRSMNEWKNNQPASKDPNLSREMTITNDKKTETSMNKLPITLQILLFPCYFLFPVPIPS